MKQWIHISGVILMAALTLRAGAPSQEAKEAVLNAENEWKTAVLKGDKGALEKLMADDLSYTHSSAKTQTKAEFIHDATSGTTVYKVIDFEDTNLRQYGSTVVVTHKATITTVQTGTLRLYITEVWAQQAGRWQMVTRQATKLL